jgi:hypothetical protein
MEQKERKNLYTFMMKSYQEWSVGKGTEDYYRTEVLPKLVEWSFLNPLGGRGMSPQEKIEMERIGKMFGFNKAWWNVFKRDSHQGGDQTLTQLQKIIAMPDNDQKNKALAQWVNSSWKVSQNAPFKQAYDRINTIKMQVNKRDPGGLRADQIQWLVDVLKNAFKGGQVPYKSLQDLWYVVTGITDGKNICDECKQAALHADVFTPYHLLRYLFGTGGGFFSEPANLEGIKKSSSEALRKFFPEKYQELIGGAPVAAPSSSSPDHAATVTGAVEKSAGDPSKTTPDADPMDDDEDLMSGSSKKPDSGSSDANQHWSDMESGKAHPSFDDYLDGKKTPAEEDTAIEKIKAGLDAALAARRAKRGTGKP